MAEEQLFATSVMRLLTAVSRLDKWVSKLFKEFCTSLEIICWKLVGIDAFVEDVFAAALESGSITFGFGVTVSVDVCSIIGLGPYHACCGRLRRIGGGFDAFGSDVGSAIKSVARFDMYVACLVDADNFSSYASAGPNTNVAVVLSNNFDMRRCRLFTVLSTLELLSEL